MDVKEKDMEEVRLSLKQIMKKDMEEELLHGIKVCNLAFHFGRRLGLSYERALDLATAGLLHDMGKLQMSRYLYGREEGSLSVEEIVRTRSHARITYDILMRYDYSDFVLETILYHHENYDGTGYPRNLIATDIPSGARVLRIVDMFVTLVSDRPYRKAFDSQVAVELLIEEVQHFDMKIFLTFQSIIHEEIEARALQNTSYQR